VNGPARRRIFGQELLAVAATGVTMLILLA
jgi:hypothetical protein